MHRGHQNVDLPCVSRCSKPGITSCLMAESRVTRRKRCYCGHFHFRTCILAVATLATSPAVSCRTNHWRLVSTVGSVLFRGTAIATTAATAAAEAAAAGFASNLHGSGGLGDDSSAATSSLNREEPETESFGYEANAASTAAHIQQDPPASQALLRANELHAIGEFDAAISEYRRAIDLENDLSPAWLNLGVSLTSLDREDEAIDIYKALVKLPNASAVDAASAYCNHGRLVQTRAGVDSILIEEGMSLFHRGLEKFPDHAGCMYNLALAIENLGRYSEARNLYLQALKARPFMGNAHLNLGNIAFRSGNWTESIFRYERAYESPDADKRLLTVSSFMLAQAHNHGTGNMRRALEYYKRAHGIDSTYEQALCATLQALRSLCLWEGWEALDARVASVIIRDVSSGKEPGPQSSYETRLTGELKSSQHLGLARLVAQEYDRVEHLPLPGDIRELYFRRTNVDDGRSQQHQRHHYHHQRQRGNAREDIEEEVTGFDGWLRKQGIETTKSSEEGMPRRGGQPKSYTDEATKGLVVAYWSYDYREHAMGHLTRGLFCSHQIHDRIFAVAASYGPDDGSPVRRSAETCAGKFLDLFSTGHLESARAMVAERPQIFVDLVGHTTGSRLGVPALKPAPIMASYLGYPGTVGAEYMDYTIADKTVAPPELANVGFSEKMVYLPHSYQANSYSMSHGFCPGGEGLRECQATTRSARGLDDFLDSWGGKGPVLCNFNSIRKMEPESFTVFMNIVKRVPGSVLLLLDTSRNPANGVGANLKAEAAAMGVHPDRIRLDVTMPRDEHVWRVSGSCDLFVDSFVYGAHTTAADALWAGLPLLTLRGYGVDDTPAGQLSSRVGASLLSALGLNELSVHSVKELEDAAVALVQSPGRLATLRKRLLAAAMNTPLFDTHLIARNIERAYEAMWEQKELGLPPGHIVVDPAQSALPPLKLGFDDDQSAAVPPRRVSRAVGRVLSNGPDMAGISDAGSGASAVTPAENMFARGVEAAAAWEEAGTWEGAEAALTTTGRLLAGDPLSVEALHLRGVALHMLGRNTEAADVMEITALLATSMKHKQPGLDTAMLWNNLDSVQQAVAEASGLPLVPGEASEPFRKALVIGPSQPTPLYRILKRHASRRDHAACVADFWKHWPAMRGHGPRLYRSSSSSSSSSTAESEDDPHRKYLPVEEGGSPERYGDGWAWELWRGGEPILAAGIAEVAATCFAGLDRYEEAWRAWKLAADIQPANTFFPLRYVACLNTAGYQERAHHEMHRVVNTLNHNWFTAGGGSAVPKIPRPGDTADGRPRPLVVAFYCFEYGNEWFPNWGPSSLGQGLGGSEEVVIHLSRELARLGFWVEVYADPIGDDVGRDRGLGGGQDDGMSGGVVWYPFKAYDVSRPPDVFVAWRYHVSLHLAEGSGRRFLWLQDLVAPYFSGTADSLDGVFCPSLYHVSVIEPEAVRSLGRVLPNGIDSGVFQDGPNSPDVFVFGSAPNRGLRAVLLMWPFIRSHVPTATLEVYYGFSDNFLKWGKDNVVRFEEWMGDMNRLLNQEGILYKGMVDHTTLHDAFARAGFILYPTAFPETGCVSLIKAMAMGAIPITSRFPNSTLPELTSEWDMGPREALASHYKMPEQDIPWLESWARAVVHASTTDHSERLQAQRDSRTQNRNPGHYDDTLLPRGASVEGEQHDPLVSVQDRRMAMKEAVRGRYAFSATAKLWAEEITREKRPRSDRGQDDQSISRP